MKKSWGGPRVTVAARSSIVRWAKRHGFIDEARSIEEIVTHCFYHPDGELPEHTVRFLRGFDRVVSLLGGREEIVSQRLAQVLRREVLAIDPRPNPGLTTHIVEQWGDGLRENGLPVDAAMSVQFEIRDRPELHDRLRAGVGGANRIILCHPGSGGLEKCCPLEALEGFMAALKSRGESPAWMIGPDEMERFGADYTHRLEGTAPVLYEESVETAADLAGGTDVFIGNDAGMTHVAALAGVSTIALFGPTDPAVWRPLGPHVYICDLPGALLPLDEWVRAMASRVDTFSFAAQWCRNRSDNLLESG